MAILKLKKLKMENVVVSLEDIVDSSSNAVVAVNCAGIIVYCNSQVEKTLGLPTRLIIGRHVEKFFPGTGLLEVMSEGKPQLGCKFVLNGDTYLSNRNPIIIDGKIVGAVAVFQDVTEIQNIIDTLTTKNEIVCELQETLANVLELSNDGIIAIDRDYKITMVNQPYASFFNKKPQDLIGMDVRELYHCKPVFARSMETGETEYGYVTTLNGKEIIANRKPIKKDGQIVGALGTVAFKTISDLYDLSQKIQKLRTQRDYYRNELDRAQRTRFTCEQIIGQSPAFSALKETVKKVAKSHSTVLIRGESGTGKELFARAIHAESSRHRGPFVRVNCAAIPENLLESELFGYKEGAFTGAKRGGHVGKFELADKGVIFLDEIGDMPLMMQAKLLRVLQEKEIERLGDTKPRKVDVRVIAATNRDLEEMIINGEFREDLYYRVNVVTLNIPPLRRRGEDIDLLMHYFIKRFNEIFGLEVAGADNEVIQIFKNHRWPGNVRELENVIERAFNVIDGNMIRKEHLPMYLHNSQKYKVISREGGLAKLVEDIEREAIVDALEACGGNKNRAAAMLGISRAGLYKKLSRYKI
ncbi:sigma 54-interacting transcriptional regulator [Desulfallas thermosapovorans]|uniref:Transcriptional regulator with PAS, ATPase and Fis domain n=1 Tax=Desulfallas thermosapovorans DSM 6562 TaxID=1121431 RepID=A0A5S4ZWG1_9FIRM|nr:sigma 54-interacting transcriptional regulator [Desulfallas thermosapovorans]TYO97355.1 transcriptional regulator with PAS, ATPase and Fis domain [Desulfallas thermosapovorans DSM 6562]